MLSLFKELEKRTGGLVVNAMFEVEEFLDAIFLVFTFGVVGLLLGGGDALDTLLKVVLEAVADTLGGLFS